MKRKLLIAGAAFFAALFLFSGFMLYREYADSKQAQTLLNRLLVLCWRNRHRRSSRTTPATPQKKPNRR